MEKVIDLFIDRAAESRDWDLVLRYQWVLNSAPVNDDETMNAFMKEKAKGY